MNEDKFKAGDKTIRTRPAGAEPPTPEPFKRQMPLETIMSTASEGKFKKRIREDLPDCDKSELQEYPTIFCADIIEMLAEARKEFPNPNVGKYYVQANKGFGAYYDYKLYQEDVIQWFLKWFSKVKT